MKSVLSRNLLELALSHCFDATEKKGADSFCQLEFSSGNLKFTTKGSFTVYEESITTIKCDSDCKLSIKTLTLLEFVKYINSDEIVLVYDEVKKSCLISSGDKKSKLALPQVDITFENIIDEGNNIFEIENSSEFISKLNFASKFCSTNFQDHPLTNIHCNFLPDKIELKSANGPLYYSTTIKAKGDQNYEFYIPKKTASVLKNIFDNEILKKISINKTSIVLKSENNCLQVFIEKSTDSFPNQISEWLEKKSTSTARVSINELSKPLRFFNGIFSDVSVLFKLENSNIELSCIDNDNHLAAKELVATESLTGTTKTPYKSKLFLDCLESLQSSWVNLDFINMKDDYDLCKMSTSDTLVLLCPAIF